MRAYFFGFFIILFLCAGNIAYRWDALTGDVGSENIEATYHVIHTVNSLQSSAWRNHFFLPTVTLGRQLDKNIPWGATKPSSTGDYIYTSFPPLGFLAPYLTLSALGLEANRATIGLFGAAVGLLSSLCLYSLCYQLIVFGGGSGGLAAFAALCGCLISVFSREALQSNGVVYWSHTLYNLLMLSTLLVLVFYRIYRWRVFSILFYVFVFMGPWLEWTAYVFSAGLIIFLIRKPSLDSELSAVRIGVVTFVSGALVYLHFVAVLGLVPATQSFLARFLARSAKKVGFDTLVAGYGLSYGLFLLLLVFLVFIYAMKENWNKFQDEKFRYIKLVLFVAAFPLLENLLMMQHATQFSFDRLKFVIPAAILISVSIAYLSGLYRYCVIFIVFAASILGVRDFDKSLQNYSEWKRIDGNNMLLVSKAKTLYDPSCSVFATSGAVRGYLNSLVRAGIYENKQVDDMAKLVTERKACAGVFLQANSPFIDLAGVEEIIIVKPDGQQIVVN